MEKKIILFVDDEPNILSGLKRMLRILRKEMDLNFVGSGKEALEFLEKNHVDVVVSDMRMPSMDGATLLKEVRKRHPEVIRMILSGHAEQSAIVETVGVAHQFLAKPTSAEDLKEVLQRACGLQDLLANTSLKTAIAKIGKLPSLPQVYADLQATLKDPDCSVEDVGKIIEKDMAMSAKVLQLVNSAFFGLFTNVNSPVRAVSLLGLDTIKSLVLSVGVFREMKFSSRQLKAVNQVWSHCLAVAVFSKRICELEGREELADNIFVAGLMHDIGKLLFLISSDIDYAGIIDQAREEKVEIVEVEDRILSSTHAEAGGYLTGLWGLTGSVVEAIAFHHRIAAYPSPSFSSALAVHVADVFANKLFPVKDVVTPELDMTFLKAAGCDQKVRYWYEECDALNIEMKIDFS